MGEILQATCKNCRHMWRPYGMRPISTPIRGYFECPKCKHGDDHEWLDDETNKLLYRRRHGLDDKEDIESLKQRVSILEQKQSLEEQQRSTLEKEIKILKEWAEQREKDFRAIEDMAREIERDEKFREENK